MRHIRQLQVLLAAHEPVLEQAVKVVASTVETQPASRVKNTGTILEKLRRNGGHTLKSMQDLGGMRLVIDAGRAEQDRVAEIVRSAFDDAQRAPRIKDRRADPEQGYRAVYVVVYPDGYPIEVQIRTLLQHMWAEWFERLADQYGRGIRYGEPSLTGGATAQSAIDWMIRLSDQIAESERSGGPPPLSVVALQLAQMVLQWLKSRPGGE